MSDRDATGLHSAITYCQALDLPEPPPLRVSKGDEDALVRMVERGADFSYAVYLRGLQCACGGPRRCHDSDYCRYPPESCDRFCDRPPPPGLEIVDLNNAEDDTMWCDVPPREMLVLRGLLSDKPIVASWKTDNHVDRFPPVKVWPAARNRCRRARHPPPPFFDEGEEL